MDIGTSLTATPSILNGNGNGIEGIPPKINFDEIPAWVTSRSKNRGAEIAAWYESYYFWVEWAGRENALRDRIVLSRAKANATLKALRESSDLMEKVENAFISLGVKANKEGLYRYAEYESPREMYEDMLQDAVENSPESGRVKELRDVITIIGQLENMGVSQDYILPIGTQKSKARDATRPINAILESDMPQDEKLEQIQDILVNVADPEISVRAFREDTRGRVSKAIKKEIDPAPATMYILPQGRELVVIWSANRVQTGAIKSRLAGVTTELQIGDPGELVKAVGMSISPKAYRLSRHKLYPDVGFIEPYMVADGAMLPEPESLKFMIQAEVAKYLPVLVQVHDEVTIPVFTIGRGILHPAEWIEKSFGCVFEKIGILDTPLPADLRDEFAFSALKGALLRYYTMPDEIVDFLPPNRDIRLNVEMTEDDSMVITVRLYEE